MDCQANCRRAVAVSVAAVFAVLSSCLAAEWRGLDDASWRSGPKLSPESLKGKVVLVDKWAVFCPPCRAALPHLEELWRKFRSQPFVLVSSHCVGDDREGIARLVKENSLTFSVYKNAGLANEPQFKAIPFFYVVDPDGKVVYQGMGFAPARAKELEDVIAAELAKLSKEKK